MDFYLRSKARFEAIFHDYSKEQKERLFSTLSKIDKAIEQDRGYLQ